MWAEMFTRGYQKVESFFVSFFNLDSYLCDDNVSHMLSACSSSRSSNSSSSKGGRSAKRSCSRFCAATSFQMGGIGRHRCARCLCSASKVNNSDSPSQEVCKAGHFPRVDVEGLWYLEEFPAAIVQ